MLSTAGHDRIKGKTKPSQRCQAFGAEVQPDGGVHYRLWAPEAKRVAVVFYRRQAPNTPVEHHPLVGSPEGWFEGLISEAGAGLLYRFQLDDENPIPDLASRFQPFGVHGPSQVIDPGTFRWTDSTWTGRTLLGQVIYELHCGSFTPEGTYTAAAGQLEGLRDVGITCLELMPVNAFPGDRGWSYDGVGLFAPQACYGTADELRALVDRAHALGIAVLLDVVYNHIGPEGNYFQKYARDFFHRDRPANEWGEALNFDGPNSEPVREFFLSNAAYWIREFHFDGLRIDATQAIHDQSKTHFLIELSRSTRRAAGERSLLLVGENEPQDVWFVKPAEEGGGGLDALWNDDFHHAAMVALTGRAEAYYSDYSGSPQELISWARWGFLFQGQFSHWQQKRRGTPALGLPACRLVSFLENHDQVANSARGERLITRVSPGRYRALTAFWLLAPQTPMLFQGQEYGSTRPFYYFADPRDEGLPDKVREGRMRFLRQFCSLATPEVASEIADPCALATFQAAVLDPNERSPRNPTCCLIRELLRMRREDPVFRRQDATRIAGAVLGPEALVLRHLGDAGDDRLVLLNLGRDLYPNPAAEPLLAPSVGSGWEMIWHSEHPDYGGSGMAPLGIQGSWRLTGQAAAVLRAVPQSIPPSTEDPAHLQREQDVEIDVRAALSDTPRH
jgi:maltooligosyltrehalose trehalohydrolase